MPEAVSIALVGIGGYGNTYVSALLDAKDQSGFRLVGAIDPSPTSCRRLAELKERGIKLFSSLEEFYESGAQAELVVVCSPLHLHAQHTIMALTHGSHVLCEKPLCVTPQQAMEMKAAQDRAGRQVAVGYQWSFSNAIQQLKADILAGRFGQHRRSRVLVLWPRDESYYGRNRWAGAIRDGQGNLVLDSPVNNACAHYLHNVLYLLGQRVDRSATVTRVTAELYRANAIENYDTAAVRCVIAQETPILMIVSHATAEHVGPIFSCEFDRCTVEFSGKPGEVIVARFNDGTTLTYGSPNDHQFAKLWTTIQSVRQNTQTLCGIEAAFSHTQCAYAAQRSMEPIRDFPRALVHVEGTPGKRKTWVDGLTSALRQCYDEFAMPKELGFDWAAAGREVIINHDGRSSNASAA